MIIAAIEVGCALSIKRVKIRRHVRQTHKPSNCKHYCSETRDFSNLRNGTVLLHNCNLHRKVYLSELSPINPHLLVDGDYLNKQGLWVRAESNSI